MRPCGIIVLIAELFTSESKSQVYGCLHDFYRSHPETAAKIGTQVVRNDAALTYLYFHTISQSTSVMMTPVI